MTLAGRGAVVTGGGRGIGAATARALAKAGAAVVVAARTRGEIEHVAEGLRAGGARAWAIECDVTNPESVNRLVERSAKELGAVDILVNNAGGGSSAPLTKLTLEEWERLLRLNVTSVFLCTRAFVPGMMARGFGRIVNVASIAGLEGAKYVSAYAASKHAVVGFTRSVALELEGRGVTINAVCPRYVDTGMTQHTLENISVRTGMSREQALAAVLETAGQEHLTPPDDVAAAILSLIEDAEANGRAMTLELQ